MSSGMSSGMSCVAGMAPAGISRPPRWCDMESTGSSRCFWLGRAAARRCARSRSRCISRRRSSSSACLRSCIFSVSISWSLAESSSESSSERTLEETRLTPRGPSPVSGTVWTSDGSVSSGASALEASSEGSVSSDLESASPRFFLDGTDARALAFLYRASCACCLEYSSLTAGRGSGTTVATAGARPITCDEPSLESTADAASLPGPENEATATTPETTATAPRPRRVHVNAPVRLAETLDSRRRSSSGASSARASSREGAAGDAGVMTPRGNISPVSLGRRDSAERWTRTRSFVRETFDGLCECDRVNGGAMYAREPVPSGDSYERDARVGVPIGPRMKPHIECRLGKLCRIGCYTILSSRSYSPTVR